EMASVMVCMFRPMSCMIARSSSGWAAPPRSAGACACAPASSMKVARAAPMVAAWRRILLFVIDRSCRGSARSIQCASLARLLLRDPVADVIDALEGGNDLLVVRHDDDRGLELARHAVQDAHDAQRAHAVQRGRRLVRQDHRRA